MGHSNYYTTRNTVKGNEIETEQQSELKTNIKDN